jgi:hypothetical protein
MEGSRLENIFVLRKNPLHLIGLHIQDHNLVNRSIGRITVFFQGIAGVWLDFAADHDHIAVFIHTG